MIRQSKEKNEQMSYIEKRTFQRIPINIDARFFHGNMFYSGIVRNLSDHGMFIDTKKCLSSDSMFVVIIRENNHLLQVIAKVKRISTNSDTYEGMGVELIRPSSGYLDLVHR
jgi:Tfp pilus assembly protein PilZ